MDPSFDGDGLGSSQPNQVRQESVSFPFWTINAGGHPGVWRLITLLESMEEEKKPGLVAVQEVFMHK